MVRQDDACTLHTMHNLKNPEANNKALHFSGSCKSPGLVWVYGEGLMINFLTH